MSEELTLSSPAPMASGRGSNARAAMPRKAVFRLAQANSLGLKARDEAGSKWRWQPAALMAALALAFLCMRRVSSTTVIPGRNVGTSQVRSH